MVVNLNTLKKKNKIIRIVGLILLGMMFFTLVVEAVDLPNDGEFKKNPYGDTKLPSTFKSLEYYDCLIPYQRTFEEVGGIAYKTISTNYEAYRQPMSEAVKKSKIGSQVMLESDLSVEGAKKKLHDKDGVTIFEDAKGNKYYGGALPKFFWSVEPHYYDFSIINRGQLFDAILTDGTVLHYCVIDAHADQDSNCDDSEGGSKDVHWAKTPIKKRQYYKLFHARGGHIIEISARNNASLNAFISRFNFGNDGNKVAAIRMYNAKIGDSPDRVGGKEPYSKISGMRLVPGGADDINSNSNGRSLIPKEDDLTGMPPKYEISESANKITLPDQDSLSIGEKYSVAMIRDDVLLSRRAMYKDAMRTGMVGVGLFLMVYAVLFMFALLFDRSQDFLESPMVQVITLGRFKYTDEQDGARGYLSMKRGMMVAVTIFLAGVFLVNEGVLLLIQKVIFWIKVGRFY